MITCSHVVGHSVSLGSLVEVRPWVNTYEVKEGEGGTPASLGLQTNAELLVNDSELDLALLHLKEIVKHYRVGLDSEVRLEDPLLATGFPVNEMSNVLEADQFTAEFEGEVEESSNNTLKSYIKFKGGQVRHGFSGSPLLNLRTCRVVGVVSETRSASTNLGGYAKPLSCILALLEKVKITIPLTLDREWQDAETKYRNSKKLREGNPNRKGQRGDIDLSSFSYRYGSIRGREREQSDIESYLATCRTSKDKNAVFLVGKSGIGKSTLAYNYAVNQSKENFRDGIKWIPLGGDPGDTDQLVRNVIAMWSDIADFNEDDDLLEIVRTRIAPKHTLLIFDDARRQSSNHSKRSKALFQDLIQALLFSIDSNASVIITTQDRYLRKYLEIDALQIDLCGVSEYSALQLLCDWAEIDEFDAQQLVPIREILKTVDYMPIAIKILGRTLNLINEGKHVDEDACRLEIDRYLISLLPESKTLDLLALPGSEYDPQWSIKASLEASLSYAFANQYDQVSDFFSCLGQCAPISITHDIAMNVSGFSNSDTDRYLKRLHALSIVDGQIGNYVIHPLIHSLALQKLKTNQDLYNSSRRRHALYILNKINKSQITHEGVLNSELDLINANFDKSVEWIEAYLLDLPKVKSLRGIKPTLLRRIKKIFSFILDYFFPPRFPKAYSFYQLTAKNLNKYCECLRTPHHAIRVLSPFQQIALDLEDWESYITIHLQLAKFFSRSDSLDQALSRLNYIYKFLPKVKQRRRRLDLRSRWLARMARVLWKKNESDHAINYFDKSVSAAREAGQLETLRNALDGRAVFFLSIKDLGRSLSDYQELCALCLEIPNHDPIELLRYNIRVDIILMIHDQHDDASTEIYKELLRKYNDPPSRVQLARAYRHFAFYCQRSGIFIGYEHAIKRSINIYKYSASESSEYVIDVFHLGTYLGKNQRYDEAVYYLCTITDYNHLPLLPDLAPLLGTLRDYGRQLQLNSRYDLAIQCFQSASIVAQKIGDQREYSKVLNKLGNLFGCVGKPKEAIDCFFCQMRSDEIAGIYSNHAYGATGFRKIARQYPHEFIDIIQSMNNDSQFNRKMLIQFLVLANKHIPKTDRLTSFVILKSVLLTFREHLSACESSSLSAYGLDPALLQRYAIEIFSLGSSFIKEEEYLKAAECLCQITDYHFVEYLSNLSPLLGSLRFNGTKLEQMSEYASAARCFESACIISKILKNDKVRSKCLNKLGGLYLKLAEIKKSIECFLLQGKIALAGEDYVQRSYAITGLAKVFNSNPSAFVDSLSDHFRPEVDETEKYLVSMAINKIEKDFFRYTNEAMQLPPILLSFKQSLGV